MLDPRLFLDQSETTHAKLLQRQVDASTLAGLQDLGQRRRHSIGRLEALRHQLNVKSGAMEALMRGSAAKTRGGAPTVVEAERAALRELKAQIKDEEQKTEAVVAELEQMLLGIPNLPADSVPVGTSDTDNQIEREWGTPTTFPFAPKAHWELAEALGIVQFDTAAKMSGARFALYVGDGARLERAIAAFMLDTARHNGYTEIAPPLLVRPEAMVAAGQYPKFKGESFETRDGEYVLIPTSEVPLVNIHRDEVLDSKRLPLRYTALTACFRREAGAAGKDTRGLIRQHQFTKVELVSYCRPEASAAELERLTANAEEVLQRLKLPYRVASLCTGDLGFASAKTYDLEVWLPAQGAYREISSCSNCTDFQARRAKIRYRPEPGAKPQLVHTLNGSGLAVGRTFVAILENYQQADGSVVIPDVLVPYLGKDAITNTESG